MTDGTPPRVLVTRPETQAKKLATQLQCQGYEPVLQPMLKIVPLVELGSEQARLLQNLDNFEHIIFVSSNAVRWGMEAIESFWPQLPVGIQWYCIGEATKQTLQEYGVRASSPGSSMSSEALLAMESLKNLDDQRVLLIRGVGGRQLLAEALQQRGAKVDLLEVYRRQKPAVAAKDIAALLAENIDIILISSGEGLRNLADLLSERHTEHMDSVIFDLPLVVPAERVAGLARKLGFKQPMVAENATDAAMIGALDRWRQESIL